MNLRRALIVAVAGAVLLVFTTPADAQRHPQGGVSRTAWHGRAGWGWHGRPGWGWGWHGRVAFVGGFYGAPYWGSPYWYSPYGYGYCAYPPPQYYPGRQEKIYDGHVARSQGDAKDFEGSPDK